MTTLVGMRSTTRRQFLKGLGIGVAAVAVAPAVITEAARPRPRRSTLKRAIPKATPTALPANCSTSGAWIPVSREMLEDSQFHMADYVLNELSFRYEAEIGRSILTGHIPGRHVIHRGIR